MGNIERAEKCFHYAEGPEHALQPSAIYSRALLFINSLNAPVKGLELMQRALFLGHPTAQQEIDKLLTPIIEHPLPPPTHTI